MNSTLLDRLSAGTGWFSAELLTAADAVPAAALRELLESCRAQPAAFCDVAYLLARRGDQAGVAALAEAATWLRTAWRAVGYLRELDLLDLVSESFADPERLDQSQAAELLGDLPVQFERLAVLAPWPAPLQREEVAVYRFLFPTRLSGLVLLRPLLAHTTGGTAHLDAADAVALAAGLAFANQARRLSAAAVPQALVTGVLKRRAYRLLSRPASVAGWQVGADLVVSIELLSRGLPGFLVGSSGNLPIHWIDAPPDEAGVRLTAEQAFHLWHGWLLLAHA
ncbi:MAG: hypothetical protein IT204_15055 [Fimbriimonadaceae bacterium]|nr:hypothetical protein [Fimbriimonadaceae bacterium]